MYVLYAGSGIIIPHFEEEVRLFLVEKGYRSTGETPVGGTIIARHVRRCRREEASIRAMGSPIAPALRRGVSA